MNKVEFYNAVVNVYNETGQGVPAFLNVSQSVINGLIQEGYLKKVTIPFNHLPDDTTICLTKGYCVEEDMVDNPKSTLPLAYLRLYKGLEQGLENMTGYTNQKLVKDPEFMVGYSEWLTKNHSKLTEKIELLDENMKFQSLTPEEKEYLISKDWYKMNKSVEDCLDQMYDRDRNLREQMGLYKQLITLYEKTDSNKVEGAKTDMTKVQNELKMRESIRDFLNECKNKKTTKVQKYYPQD
jgi:hypothetical protein